MYDYWFIIKDTNEQPGEEINRAARSGRGFLCPLQACHPLSTLIHSTARKLPKPHFGVLDGVSLCEWG